MKTKLWILGFVLAGVPALAAVPKQQQMVRLEKGILSRSTSVRESASARSPFDPADPILLEPVRMAKAKFTFHKGVLRIEDNHYYLREEDLCSGEVEAPVYDLSDMEDGQSYQTQPGMMQCQTVVEGQTQPVLLTASADIWLEGWDHGPATKAFWGGLFVASEQLSWDPFAGSSSRSEDMDLAHLETSLSKVQVASRSEGEIEFRESVWVTIEYRDDGAAGK